MKTVTGRVLSTTPISLSKATSILSKFVNADTNASPALCAYLRRASVSFNELSQLHKELKSSRKHKISKRKRKEKQRSTVKFGKFCFGAKCSVAAQWVIFWDCSFA
ncbi:hypothetical protein Patl1_30812 [Pistacia atlantica]|uniref:Uncharacterized protein n=1 Tax=Pistacia atlantica TaxID=434234 RepID=A0ACC1ACT6_9ROSI|nr:hypothetical protein Patl1_30812 [Pistacia atlantica]